jgi:adenylate cyclase
MRAFKPRTATAYAGSATDSYLKAFEVMESGDRGAISAFAAQLGRQPTDQLASFHLERLLNGAIGTRIL